MDKTLKTGFPVGPRIPDNSDIPRFSDEWDERHKRFNSDHSDWLDKVDNFLEKREIGHNG
jgi:hypothetical protein